MGVRRDKTAFVDECDPRCGTCAALTGGTCLGGTGGTGSRPAQTGVQISSHGTISFGRRFAICAKGVIRPDVRHKLPPTGGQTRKPSAPTALKAVDRMGDDWTAARRR